MKRSGIVILGSIALLLAACGAPAGDVSSRATATGGIGFRLQLPSGANVASIDYTISGPSSYEKNGSLSGGSDQTFAGKIDGIPVGDGYIIMLLTHASQGDVQCEGSANFSVRASLVTAIGVRLECPGEKSDAGAAGSVATTALTVTGGAGAASGGGSAHTQQPSMQVPATMGGSPAVAMQGGASATATGGHSATTNTSTGGAPATSTTAAAGGTVSTTTTTSASSNCPRIDCVSAVPAADGKSVTLHGVALGTSATDQHTFEWTTTAGTLSDAASSDPVLQCPTTAGDIDVSFRVRAGTCNDELGMRVTCSATAH